MVWLYWLQICLDMKGQDCLKTFFAKSILFEIFHELLDRGKNNGKKIKWKNSNALAGGILFYE